MIRIGGLVFLLIIPVLALTGCKVKPDRMITADGSILSGKLESIDGQHIVFNNSETMVEFEEGRVFLRDDGGSFRGYITCSGGKISVLTDSGEREFSKGDIESIIWSNPADEIVSIIDVHAVDGWVNSGIEIREDDRICICATGTVTMETGTSGPSGIDYFSTSTALVPGATNGQLVVAVGDFSPVAAGSTWTDESPGNGELQLAVNIPDRESTEGVGGTYTVTVIRTAGSLNNSALYPAKN